jgi:hypothetical protein
MSNISEVSTFNEKLFVPVIIDSSVVLTYNVTTKEKRCYLAEDLKINIPSRTKITIGKNDYIVLNDNELEKEFEPLDSNQISITIPEGTVILPSNGLYHRLLKPLEVKLPLCFKATLPAKTRLGQEKSDVVLILRNDTKCLI